MGVYIGSLGVNLLGGIVGEGGTSILQEITVSPETYEQIIDPDEGYDGFSQITVTPIQTEEKTAISNGEVVPTEGKFLTKVTVDVPTPTLQSKTVIPSETEQNITPDSGVYGLSSVNVKAIDKNYVGSGISRKSSTNLTVSGATVTVPTGYYASDASKSVATGSISVNTPSINTSTGVVTASTTLTTAGYVASNPSSKTLNLTTQAAKTVTPTASEQTAVSSGVYTTGAVKVAAVPTETKTVSENGTYTPTSGKFFSNFTVNIPIQKYYTGNITPSTSIGNDNDLYLKVQGEA